MPKNVPNSSCFWVSPGASWCICDATVSATDGNYAETLTPFGDGGTCQYFGAYDRSGTYAIEASSAGRTALVTNVVVTSST